MDESEISFPTIEPPDAPTAAPGAVEVFSARSADALATSHRSLQMLYAYWAARCGARPMPSRADVDPVDLKSVLPMLILIDVVPDPRRYVYRLVGTREVEMRSGDPTGKAVEEAYYGESAEETIRYLDRVAETRQPLFYRGTYKPLRTRTQRDDILFLPLSNDGERVNMIMVLSHTEWVKDERQV
jgi:hypothetical protein